MKRFLLFTILTGLSLAPQLVSAQSFRMFSQTGDRRTTLILKPDGSCDAITDSEQSRTRFEQQVRLFERFRNMDADDETDQTNAQPAQADAAAKPFTDAELEKKFREIYQEMVEDNTGAEDTRFEVAKDTVRIHQKRSFSSLEEMLAGGSHVWSPLEIPVENVRIEEDTNGLVRVTLTPMRAVGRYLKGLRSQWKLTEVKGEFRIVFPGKVVSSSFPDKNTNATWLAIDGKKDESIDTAAKLFDQPLVFTAEPGGLKLDQPLDSSTLERASQAGRGSFDEVPITDAGPGYVAEPLGLTMTTLHVFPEGAKHFTENDSFLSLQRTGVVVNARFFPPKDRTLLSTGRVRVLKASDDKGRAIGTGDTERDEMMYDSGDVDESDRGGSVRLQLPIALPQTDAQAIEEISAETIVVTAGTWKEMSITNLQENATNEMDLGAILPGAKIVLKKVNLRGGQRMVQVEIKGPAAIQRLRLSLKGPAGRERQVHSSAYEQSFRTVAGRSSRVMSVQSYGTGPDSESSSGPATLIIRSPQELRRERVRFTVKGLDLL